MQKHEYRDSMIGCAATLACEVIFGLSYIFTKQAINSASTLTLLGWRFLLAFLILLLCYFLGIIKIQLKGKKIRPLLIVALFSPVIYYVCETIGISYTTTSESGAFLACIPVASLLASTLILKEKPKKIQVAGITVTLTGVLITVFAVGLKASFSAVGYVMLAAAVISYSLYSVFVEKSSGYTEMEITFVMLAAGAAVYVTLALAEALIKGNLAYVATLPFTNMSFLSAILYQGIGCSILAFFLSNVAISKIGVNRTSSFIGVSTVVSIAAGILVLNEAFSVIQVIGAIVILSGVYIANSKL